jgi:hypothetical protein
VLELSLRDRDMISHRDGISNITKDGVHLSFFRSSGLLGNQGINKGAAKEARAVTRRVQIAFLLAPPCRRAEK